MGYFLLRNKSITHNINVEDAVISATNEIKRKQHNKKHGIYVSGNKEAIYNLLLGITDNIFYLSYHYVYYKNGLSNIRDAIYRLFIEKYGHIIRYNHIFDNNKIVNYYATSFLNKNDIAYDLNRSAGQGSRILRSKYKYNEKKGQKHVGQACIIYLWHVIEYRPQIDLNKRRMVKSNSNKKNFRIKRYIYGAEYKPQKVVSKYDYLRFIMNNYRYKFLKVGYNNGTINYLRIHHSKTGLAIFALNMQQKLSYALDEVYALVKWHESGVRAWRKRLRIYRIQSYINKIRFYDQYTDYINNPYDVIRWFGRNIPKKKKELKKLKNNLYYIDQKTLNVFKAVNLYSKLKNREFYLLYKNDIIEYKEKEYNNISKLSKQAVISENKKALERLYPNWENMIDIPLNNGEKDPFKKHKKVIPDKSVTKHIKHFAGRPMDTNPINPTFQNDEPSTLIDNINSSSSASASKRASNYNKSVSNTLSRSRYNFSISASRADSSLSSKIGSLDLSESASVSRAVATNSICSLSYYHPGIYSTIANSLNESLSASVSVIVSNSVSNSESLSNSISESKSISNSASISKSISVSQSLSFVHQSMSKSTSISKSAFISSKASEFQSKNPAFISSLTQSLARANQSSYASNTITNINISNSDNDLPF